MEGKERSVVMAWYWFLSPKKGRKVAVTACHQNIFKTMGVCVYIYLFLKPVFLFLILFIINNEVILINLILLFIIYLKEVL
jgi:hypothetical protein